MAVERSTSVIILTSHISSLVHRLLFRANRVSKKKKNTLYHSYTENSSSLAVTQCNRSCRVHDALFLKKQKLTNLKLLY